MDTKKILLEHFGEYFWVVGLSVFLVGATQRWSNPLGQMVVGAVLFLLGVGIKAWIKPTD